MNVTINKKDFYTYRYYPEKKISDTETRMACVFVRLSSGKLIGRENMSKYDDPVKMVGHIIHDYEVKKMWKGYKPINKR